MKGKMTYYHPGFLIYHTNCNEAKEYKFKIGK